MASLPSSLRNRNGFSSMRLLGVLKQQESSIEDRALELEEDDVVWSPSCFSDQSESHSPVDSAGPNSPLSVASTCRSSSSLSPSGNQALQRQYQGRRIGRQFTQEKFGLSAALAEESGPLVQQRRPSFDPSASATTAARAVPPVPVQRLSLGSDGFSPLFGKSAPVNVPAWPKNARKCSDQAPNEEEDWQKDTENGDIVPPHLIVAKSHATTTFSVFEGVGRTLKGRDLRRVRNAVFQKTGFLE